jgi:hypothetical protein
MAAAVKGSQRQIGSRKEGHSVFLDDGCGEVSVVFPAPDDLGIPLQINWPDFPDRLAGLKCSRTDGVFDAVKRHTG